MLFVQVANIPQLFHREDIAYDSRALEENEGANRSLAGKLLHEIISHERLFQDATILLAYLVRQREVIPAVGLYTLTKPAVTHQNLLVNENKVVLY